ncbi:MAG: hypothetical protein HS105_01500 [Chloracidobacterium sp.]|nr:hypothetical protein [Chloracidobacterium sp.]MCO5333929.1 hypothetical protein [Pyrinomonadaceae bacterium]
MSGRNVLITMLIAAAGVVVIADACGAYTDRTAPNINGGDREAPPQHERTPPGEPGAAPIAADNISELKLVTVYRGFFPKGDKCAKTYNEYFGNDDGFMSSESPCDYMMTVNRDGSAERVVTIRRWNKAEKRKDLVEETRSTASLTPDRFAELAKKIADNEAFREWRDGMSLTAGNTSITATHTAGKRTVMSNVSETTTAFLPMLDHFRDLNSDLKWTKAELK